MAQNQRVAVAEIECLLGPLDGTLIPDLGKQFVMKQFEKSPTNYIYRRALDDTGAPFWEFAGVAA